MTIINKSTSVGKDVEKTEPSFTVSVFVNWCRHYGKQYRDYSRIKNTLPYNPEILFLGNYPEKSKP